MISLDKETANSSDLYLYLRDILVNEIPNNLNCGMFMETFHTSNGTSIQLSLNIIEGHLLTPTKED